MKCKMQEKSKCGIQISLDKMIAFWQHYEISRVECKSNELLFRRMQRFVFSLKNLRNMYCTFRYVTNHRIFFLFEINFRIKKANFARNLLKTFF